MRYPVRYVWLVFLASLDIMMTWVILLCGGWEVNAIAAAVIDNMGLPGAVLFKFALVMFVIILCEVVGRRHNETGRKLAEWAIAITSIPVLLSFVQLLS